jgi:hypothetical protein
MAGWEGRRMLLPFAPVQVAGNLAKEGLAEAFTVA